MISIWISRVVTQGDLTISVEALLMNLDGLPVYGTSFWSDDRHDNRSVHTHCAASQASMVDVFVPMSWQDCTRIFVHVAPVSERFKPSRTSTEESACQATISDVGGVPGQPVSSHTSRPNFVLEDTRYFTSSSTLLSAFPYASSTVRKPDAQNFGIAGGGDDLARDECAKSCITLLTSCGSHS